jgi:competence protein ComEC
MDMTVPPKRATADLRLLVGGLAAWLTALGTFELPVSFGIAIGVLSFVGAACGMASRRPAAAAVTLVLGCVGAAALTTALRLAAAESSPLATLAHERASITADLVVSEDPQPLSAGSGPPRVATAARIEHVVAGGRGWSLSGRVLVLAPAEGWQQLLPGQRVQAEGRLSPPARRDLTVAVLSARSAPDRVQAPPASQSAAGRIRAGLRDAAGVLPDGPQGLLPGLALGDTTVLDPALAEDFRTAGLSHLTAVSGANCTIVTGAVLLLLRAATLGPRLSAAAAGLSLAGFVILVRPSPTVLRAAVMGGIGLLALASGRPRSALPALGAAVLGLVLISPPLARDPGFALSVLATFGLIVLAPIWAERLRSARIPRGAAEALAVPLSAALVTAPVIAALSGQISLVTVPANLLAAPAVAPATVLGVLAAVVSPVSAGAAEWLVRLAGLPVGWLAAVATRAAHVPAATVSWPGGMVGGLALVVALAVGAVIVRVPVARRVALATAVGAAVVLIPVRIVTPGWPPGGWLFVACSVGQGDALVVRAGRGAAIVVDAGPEPVSVDGCLRRLGVRSVPLLVLSHFHADHVGGLAGVLRGRAVGEIDVGPAREPAAAWREVERVAVDHGVPLRTATAGERREVGGVLLDVLGPTHAYRGTRSDPNNSSVVLKVWSEGHSILLTGDVEVEAQAALVRAGIDLKAEVIKVPHHGSPYQDPEFLRAVHASVAVVSVGRDNDYGHPSALLLSEMAREGARTLRTDLNGDVAVCERDGRLAVVARSREPP